MYIITGDPARHGDTNMMMDKDIITCFEEIELYQEDLERYIVREHTQTTTQKQPHLTSTQHELPVQNLRLQRRKPHTTSIPAHKVGRTSPPALTGPKKR
jgi:hypothetical protein